MQIEFDPAKREKTRRERNLDFARADEVFRTRHLTAENLRQDYKECRYITVGTLGDDLVVMVWTPRGEARRIISMRKANEREKSRYARALE